MKYASFVYTLPSLTIDNMISIPVCDIVKSSQIDWWFEFGIGLGCTHVYYQSVRRMSNCVDYKFPPKYKKNNDRGHGDHDDKGLYSTFASFGSRLFNPWKVTDVNISVAVPGNGRCVFAKYPGCVSLCFNTFAATVRQMWEMCLRLGSFQSRLTW